MATQQKEAKDLGVKITTYIRAKSAVEAPKRETCPMGKVKAEVTKSISTFKVW